MKPTISHSLALRLKNAGYPFKKAVSKETFEESWNQDGIIFDDIPYVSPTLEDLAEAYISKK